MVSTKDLASGIRVKDGLPNEIVVQPEGPGDDRVRVFNIEIDPNIHPVPQTRQNSVAPDSDHLQS